MIKWISASNAFFFRRVILRHVEHKKKQKQKTVAPRASTYEPDESDAVLPARVIREQRARRGGRDDGDGCDASEGERGRRGED